jgi:hypothetical protein
MIGGWEESTPVLYQLSFHFIAEEPPSFSDRLLYKAAEPRTEFF